MGPRHCRRGERSDSRGEKGDRQTDRGGKSTFSAPSSFLSDLTSSKDFISAPKENRGGTATAYRDEI